MSKDWVFSRVPYFPFVGYFSMRRMDGYANPEECVVYGESGSEIADRLDEIHGEFAAESYKLERKYTDLLKSEFPQFAKFMPQRLGDCNEQTKN